MARKLWLSVSVLLFLAALALFVAVIVFLWTNAPWPRPTPSPPPSAASPLPTALVPVLDAATAARCREQAASYIAQLDPVVSTWVVARQTAGRAPAADLPAQVAKLEAVRQQAKALNVPTCAEGASLSLFDTMDHTIAAYRGFVDELPDAQIREELDQANAAFQRYVAWIDQIR